MNFISKTLIPVLLAVAALLTAIQPFYASKLDAKEREKGELVVALMKDLECRVKITTKR